MGGVLSLDTINCIGIRRGAASAKTGAKGKPASSAGYVNLDTGAVGGSSGKKTLLVEVIGTFFLSLALFKGFDTVLHAFGCGAMLALWTWLGGGAYNPAVTVASTGSSFVGKGITKSHAKSLLLAILAQIVGATLAALFASSVGGDAIDVSAPATNVGGELIKSSVVEAMFVVQLVLTYLTSSDALVLGLSYSSGLFAFGTSLSSTGNPAVVIGVALGNAVLGNGFALSQATIAHSVVPLFAGSFAIVVFDVGCKKIPHFLEGIGTFYLASGMAGILKQGGVGSSDCYLAIGTTLANWMVIGGGEGSYNPAVTLARYVNKDRVHSLCSSAFLKGPALDILAQIVGAVLAAITSSWAMDAEGFQWLAMDSDFSGNLKPAILDCLATAALALAYLAKADTTGTGLAYFGLLFAFAAKASSSFNPALPVGSYLAGLAGFGGGGAVPLAPLVGGLAGAILAGSADNLPKDYFPREAMGVFYLCLVVGASGGDGIFGALAIGAATIAFTKIYDADLNPAVTLGASYNPQVSVASNLRSSSSKIMLQLGGASVAAILGFWLTGFDGTATDAFSVKAASAEVLASLLLVKAYPTLRPGRDPKLIGLSYFAILAAFFSAMGSVANPALVFGRFIGNGLMGSGFDLSEGALKALLAHILAPLAGAVLCSAWKMSLKIEIEFHKLLDKIKWSHDMVKPGEFVGSFFLVVLLSAIGSGSQEALLAGGMALTALLTMISGQDLIPTITVARVFSGMTLKTSRAQVVELLLSTCFQTLGALVAIYLTTWLLGLSAGVPLLGTSMEHAVIRGFLITLILSLGWLSKEGQLATGLAYFIAASTCSGGLDPALATNPAFVLGNLLHSLMAGNSVSSDELLLVIILVPLAGGLAGGFLLKFLRE